MTTEKTTVTITTHEGQTHTYAGDAILLFTYDDIEAAVRKRSDGIKSNVVLSGMFPKAFAEKMIASAVCIVMKQIFKNPLDASYHLHNTAVRLKEYSSEMNESILNNMDEKELGKHFIDFIFADDEE